MLDAAFGKGNEDSIVGLGRQLAMYAWFKGDSKTLHPFTKLMKCNSLDDCFKYAILEIFNNQTIMNLINSNNYAKSKLFTSNNMITWKKDYSTMSGILSNASSVDAIRDTTITHDTLHDNRTVLTMVGSGIFTVPSGIDCITVCCIGGGNEWWSHDIRCRW